MIGAICLCTVKIVYLLGVCSLSFSQLKLKIKSSSFVIVYMMIHVGIKTINSHHEVQVATSITDPPTATRGVIGTPKSIAGRVSPLNSASVCITCPYTSIDAICAALAIMTAPSIVDPISRKAAPVNRTLYPTHKIATVTVASESAVSASETVSIRS